MTARELCRVYNLGQRMELVCDKSVSNELIAIAKKFNLEAKIIGHTVSCTKGKESLTIQFDGETLSYDRNK
jgi:phosphoribosylformylglycinamidine cyclo-ligase